MKPTKLELLLDQFRDMASANLHTINAIQEAYGNPNLEQYVIGQIHSAATTAGALSQMIAAAQREEIVSQAEFMAVA